MKYKIVSLLPWNHYARKMLGYLKAMEAGASILVDTDDDNRIRATVVLDDLVSNAPDRALHLFAIHDGGFGNVLGHDVLPF